MSANIAESAQHFKTSFYIFVLVTVVIFFIVLLFWVFWFTGCSKTPQGAPMETNTQDMMENKDTKKNKSVHANHKYLMLLGIFVACVTYLQADLEPPGGAWQSSNSG
jgi:Na+/melibiose symporter-like transporter